MVIVKIKFFTLDVSRETEAKINSFLSSETESLAFAVRTSFKLEESIPVEVQIERDTISQAMLAPLLFTIASDSEGMLKVDEHTAKRIVSNILEHSATLYNLTFDIWVANRPYVFCHYGPEDYSP